MKKTFRIPFILLVTWFSMHTILITIDGLTDDNIKSDVGVIFGNTVNPDGSLSERLEKRLDKGIALYEDSTIQWIIVSGGLGKEGYYEGTKMYEYLNTMGIPRNKIIIDDYGTTTEATAENVGKMNLDVNSIVVISQYYHISRAKLALKKNGFSTVYGAHADYFELRDFYSLCREFLGYYKYLFLS